VWQLEQYTLQKVTEVFKPKKVQKVNPSLTQRVFPYALLTKFSCCEI